MFKKQILITLSLSFILLLFFSCNDKEETCDSDNDGCIDIFDDFPENADYYRDTDGDGIPDPQLGTDSTEWDIDADGDNIVDWNDTEVSLKLSCLDDSDGDGCNDLFDHYPHDPEKDTNYELGDNIPSCDERMNDCMQTYPLYLNTNYE